MISFVLNTDASSKVCSKFTRRQVLAGLGQDIDSLEGYFRESNNKVRDLKNRVAETHIIMNLEKMLYYQLGSLIQSLALYTPEAPYLGIQMRNYMTANIHLQA